MADATRRHRETVMRAMHPRSVPTHGEAWLDSGGKPSGAPCWRVYNKLAQAICDTEAEALAPMPALVARVEAVRVAVERAVENARHDMKVFDPRDVLVNLIEELEKT